MKDQRHDLCMKASIAPWLFSNLVNIPVYWFYSKAVDVWCIKGGCLIKEWVHFHMVIGSQPIFFEY